VGAPCNICVSEDPIFASITRLDVSKAGAKPEIYAHGVRNSVGMTWHPETKELWFTDNGRDMLGDDTPDCELNKAKTLGQHFGYPYWHAGTIKDPEVGSEGKEAAFYTAPEAKLGAHTAPLGLRFYTGDQFPATYKNQLFIAKHGSWNRSKKSGYEVVLARLDTMGKVSGQEVMVSGWLDQATQEAWGRPVDVQQLVDGSLLISDDVANCIYRLSYTAN
jgi:glucose/arabinose dehydrogenase